MDNSDLLRPAQDHRKVSYRLDPDSAYKDPTPLSKKNFYTRLAMMWAYTLVWITSAVYCVIHFREKGTVLTALFCIVGSYFYPSPSLLFVSYRNYLAKYSKIEDGRLDESGKNTG